jgi:hypothetical protein
VKGGTVQQLLAIVGVGLVAISHHIFHSLSIILNGLVASHHIFLDHVGLGDNQLKDGVGLKIVPIDCIQDMFGGQKGIDLYEKLALLDVGEVDTILFQDGNDLPETLESRVLVLAVGKKILGAIVEHGMLGIIVVEAAQQCGGEEILVPNELLNIVGEAMGFHEFFYIGLCED